MKNKNLFCILFICTLVSCKKEVDSIEYRLCGNNYKYWLLIDSFSDSKRDSTHEVQQMSFFYFNSSGKFLSYWKYNIYTVIRVDSFPHYDMVAPNTWGIEKDSILILNGFVRYRIKYLSKDMMILQHNYSKIYDLYFNVCDSLLFKDDWIFNKPNVANNVAKSK